MQKNRLWRLGQFCCEALEQRTLLANTVGTTFSVTGTDFSALPTPTPSGFQATLGVNLDGEAPGNPELTGTVTFGWWGGASLATVTVVPYGPDPSFDTVSATTTVTLDAKSAGEVLTSGPYAGDHVLYAVYSGDGFWPATTFTDADFQALEQPGASSGGVSAVVGFAVTHQLAVTAGPSNTATGDIISPAIKVAVLDPSGSIDTSFSTNVSAVITSTSTGTGSLGGNTSIATVDGVATFSDLSIDKPGQYSLSFTDTQADYTASGLFQITGGKLVFLSSPRNGTAGKAISPAVRVALEDGHGKIITTDSSSVVTLSPFGSTSANPISGNTQTLAAGIATFSDVVLSTPATYQLQATDGGDTMAISRKFKLASLRLFFSTQPSNVAAQYIVPLQVELRDTHNVLDTTAASASDVLVPTITPDIPGNAIRPDCPLQGGVFVGSEANRGVIISNPGYYRLTFTPYMPDASTGLLVPDPDLAPVTSAKFRVLGLHLEFQKQPTTSSVQYIIPLEVDLRTSRRALATTSESANDMLEATVSPTPSSGVITPVVMLRDGVYAPSDSAGAPGGIIVNKPGTYTITYKAFKLDSTTGSYVPDDSVEAVTSKKFKVQGQHLSFLEEPTTARAQYIIPLQVELLDAHDHPVTTGSSADDFLYETITPRRRGGITPVLQLQNGTYFASDIQGGIIITQPGLYTVTFTAYTDASTQTVDPEVQAVKSVKFKVI